jgi:methyltransferase (TIGR00027 family)
MARAAHLLLDGEPKILQDELALGFSGMANEAALRTTWSALQTEIVQRSVPAFAQSLLSATRATNVVRSRYAEDELSKALQRGVSQYVLLGAGLDSFAYRRRDLEGVVRVFEVDHPATQQWKRARLHELNVTLPSHLTFVPSDFEHQTLREALAAGGYRAEAPAFFSWLGVTQYLTPDAILRTLREIASLAPETEVVFEYSVPEEQPEGVERQYLAFWKAWAAERGEPWLGFFDPRGLVTQVKRLGFTGVTDVSPAELNARYFANRRDGLRTPQAQRFVKARVGSVH